MTEEQLKKARELKVTQSNIENTLKRIENLKLSWNQNDCNYRFTKDELGNDPILIEMFNNVKDTATTLLQSNLEKYLKKVTKEFEKL
jgi:hypothetical protein